MRSPVKSLKNAVFFIFRVKIPRQPIIYIRNNKMKGAKHEVKNIHTEILRAGNKHR